MPSQWVDGEMNVKVELQALGLPICVFYLLGNILHPQFKEHLLVSIVKTPKEVFLEKSELGKIGWEDSKDPGKISSTSRNYLQVLWQ